jgi:hypothetical protein
MYDAAPMKNFIYSLALVFIASLAGGAECPPGQIHVKAHHRRAYTRADGKFVKEAAVTAHCRTKRKSDDYWHERFSKGRPGIWPHRKETEKAWTPEEVERVLEALCELPEELWNKSAYKIYRMDRSHLGGNPASSANGIVVLYDSAFDKGRTLARILAHELAHERYEKLSESEIVDYRMALNWFVSRTKGKTVIISRKAGFVADDGRVSPEEDFANNVEFYLFEPNKLKIETPHGFRWIRNHFGDKFSIRSCGK